MIGSIRGLIGTAAPASSAPDTSATWVLADALKRFPKDRATINEAVKLGALPVTDGRVSAVHLGRVIGPAALEVPKGSTSARAVAAAPKVAVAEPVAVAARDWSRSFTDGVGGVAARAGTALLSPAARRVAFYGTAVALPLVGAAMVSAAASKSSPAKQRSRANAAEGAAIVLGLGAAFGSSRMTNGKSFRQFGLVMAASASLPLLSSLVVTANRHDAKTRKPAAAASSKSTKKSEG